MAKYNVSDKFYLDGGQVAYSEMVEIVQILPSLKENEPTYLAVCRRFSVHDESFENISYALHSDITLGECGYVKQ